MDFIAEYEAKAVVCRELGRGGWCAVACQIIRRRAENSPVVRGDGQGNEA